jgi:peptide/nickel transport system permease protein
MAVSVPVQELAQAPSQPVRTRSAWQILLHSRKFMFGVSVFVILLVVCLVGGWLTGPVPLRSGSFPPKLQVGAPGLAILGTTTLGQSVAAQLFQAIPNSMLVGFVAALIGTTLGAIIGLMSGYFGGKTDGILRILIDVFLSVPALLFAILVASLLHGVSVFILAFIIGMFAWAWPSRAVRAQILSLKERPFVQVAELSGLNGWEIVTGELTPYLLPWLGANFVNAFIAAILAESALSILGLGPQQQMTLGQMIYWALSYGALLQNMWWWWAVPVVTLILLFLALYLVHVALDELTNPRLRGAA